MQTTNKATEVEQRVTAKLSYSQKFVHNLLCDQPNNSTIEDQVAFELETTDTTGSKIPARENLQPQTTAPSTGDRCCEIAADQDLLATLHPTTQLELISKVSP